MNITLTIPDAQAPRITRVLGLQLGLKNPDGTPRSATLAEAKGWMAARLRDVVRSYELNEAAELTKAGVADISIS